MRVLIAAGGTGGTLYPGIALAQGIVRRAPDADVVFVGAGRPVETLALRGTPWRLVTLAMPRIKGQSLIVRLWTILQLPVVLIRALLLVRRLRPSLVLGIGGYAAGPVPLAAALQGIPMAIVVPDAIPGLANRWLARFARRIFLGFREAASFFPAHKVRVTGNPVREEVLTCSNGPLRANPQRVTHSIVTREAFRADRPVASFTVLCSGGSQGARSLNRAVVEALPHLRTLAGKIVFIHQVGAKEDLKRIESAYRVAGFAADVTPFIDRMWESLARADLVITRAGASTIAELMALAKPAILVPYPFAADDHQRANAEVIARLGGAIMILDRDLSGERLASEIMRFVTHPELLDNMQVALKKDDAAQASDRIVEECWKMMKAA
ncbi:MAG: undecaprenyldiphospho-muramoylpentapeptide beta-N-acetylglucosaminyltransferase [Deltaproteobacteria bacterium]|nr:undecaprenyldiphospho-muramoylpentapeptide beta-N-acetylglucosaminyltransferase [Deltaproteobacteria bacterium]